MRRLRLSIKVMQQLI